MSDKTIFQGGAPSGCRFRLASVFILDVPYHVDKLFDYVIPDDMSVKTGDLVAVPFGGGNRPETAIVFGIKSAEEEPGKFFKPVSHILDSTLSLSKDEMEIVKFLKNRTFCTTGEAVRTVVPAVAFSKLEQQIKICAPLPDYYPDCSVQYRIYNYIRKKDVCFKSTVAAKFGTTLTQKVISLLSEHGILSTEICVKELSNIKYDYFAEPVINSFDESSATEILRSKKMRSGNYIRILRFLAEKGRSELQLLLSETASTQQQVKNLTEKGLVKIDKIERYRSFFLSGNKSGNIVLNEEQRKAADTIIALTNENAPKAALLFGVTGSGKTQVIRAVAAEVLKKGKSVIMLVPEIALTPQTISFFSAVFGDRMAVIHSGLSAGERFDAWRKIKKGLVSFCIGTRSAVFAPFQNLGLIVIDEEQEHTYKSDSSPKYATKDVAALRCKLSGAVMLLASATPSVESYYKADTGKYTLCELTGRYGESSLPDTKIIDMKKEVKNGNASFFGSELLSAVKSAVNNGKQAVLFVNRRGYHRYVSCTECGNVIMCPHCSVSLTHHKHRLNQEGYLLCHYCGFKTLVPEKCPVCGNRYLKFSGFGTQLAENQLRQLLPGARILRMDSDTTASKDSYDRIITQFKNREADILIGTQMVTKGHDFPDVTVVGMLSADQSLYADDFRASERAFSLICQTIGRAGRRKDAGMAYLQTFAPDHPLLMLACKQDYKQFYRNEIKLRKALTFPPFCDIAVLTTTSDSEETAFMTANKLSADIKKLQTEKYGDLTLQLFGPFEAPVYKLSEKYRVRMVVKFRINTKSCQFFSEILRYFGDTMPKNITLSIDINPVAL